MEKEVIFFYAQGAINIGKYHKTTINMNELLINMKNMRRAMRPYVLFLYELVLELRPEMVLEIGFRQAQSTRTILSALKDNNFGKLTTISIDLPDSKGRITDDIHAYWSWVSSDSHDDDCVKIINSFNNSKKYQAILIDGDHSYDGVKKDFDLYSPLLANGGYIIFHDVLTESCGVPQFWLEVKENNEYEALTLSYGGAGMGVLRKK